MYKMIPPEMQAWPLQLFMASFAIIGFLAFSKVHPLGKCFVSKPGLILQSGQWSLQGVSLLGAQDKYEESSTKRENTAHCSFWFQWGLCNSFFRMCWEFPICEHSEVWALGLEDAFKIPGLISEGWVALSPTRFIQTYLNFLLRMKCSQKCFVSLKL